MFSFRPLNHDADRAHHRPASDWRRCHQYALALAIPIQWHVIFDMDSFAWAEGRRKSGSFDSGKDSFAWAAHAHARAADAEPGGCH